MKRFAWLGLVALALFALACNSTATDGAGATDFGSIQAALAAPASFDDFCPGIEGLRVEVLDLDGNVVETMDTHVKDETFPSYLFPGLATEGGVPLEDLGSEHRFGDAYFVLMPGTYKVRAMAIAADGDAYEGCSTPETEVVVHAGLTSEVFLVVQCSCATGGLDVVVMLNCPPIIWDLDYAPNKFVCCGTETTVTVQAEDPEDDPFTYAFELISPAGLDDVVSMSVDGNEMTFSGPQDNYEFRVTVTDITGAAGSLVFPVHVMGRESGCEGCGGNATMEQ